MKNYNNELKLVESLLSNTENIEKIKKEINEKFDNIESTYDASNLTFYIWDKNNQQISEDIKSIIPKYILENTINIEYYNPNIIFEDQKNVYVIYCKDNTMYNIYYTEDEAKVELEKLNNNDLLDEEYYIKVEPLSNFIDKE